MSQEYRREYLVRLPLPLAQLYARAYNAKDPRGRHDNTFYLFEALVKLAAATAIAGYLRDTEQGTARVEVLDRWLVNLALPSLGQWTGMLRALADHFGDRADAASHPLGHLKGQLHAPRRDRPALLALYRRIKNGPDGSPADVQSCSTLQVLDALVQYRNGVFGHGAARFQSFYEHEMGPLLFQAANELLAEGVFDPIGPRGSRLVYLTELRAAVEGRVEVGLRELLGLQGERSAPLVLDRVHADALRPNRVAVVWPGHPQPLRLDPLLLFQEGELADEVLFLNRDRDGRQVEYLSYTTGHTRRDRSTAPELAALLSRITGREVSEGQLAALAEQRAGETPSFESLMDPSAPSARRWGDYEVLAELGRGGMGIVYLARQLSLGRLVALKTLPAELAGDEVALARFRREMRLLARCDDPHIVKLLTSGTMPDGQLFYAMEYVPGCDLEQVWRELSDSGGAGDASRLSGSAWNLAVLSAARKRREQETGRAGRGEGGPATDPANASPVPAWPLPPLPELPSAPDDPGGYARSVATLIRDAALALQTVHDRGVVHRDVKPANLLLTPDGARIVLMDFGLAKGASLALADSARGGLLGTLRYAAPEQLAAASLQVGPAADVRGLGVTLWELLARRRLFAEAEDERQLATLVHDHDLPRLRAIDPGLDRDLEAIVARATERRVADRIPTAARLAEYLQLYLDGQPLPIRPPTAAELLARWVRGHKALVGSSAAAALAIIAALLIVGGTAIAHRTRGLALVQSLMDAEISRVPGIVEQLQDYRYWADPQLVADLRTHGEDSPRKLRVALGLLHVDPGQVNYLTGRLLRADAPTLVVIRDALGSAHRRAVAERMWRQLGRRDDPVAWFRAACALGKYAPLDPRWEPHLATVVDLLMDENRHDPVAINRWAEALDPLLPRLIAPLLAVYRDGKSPTDRALAAKFLLDHADRPEDLVEAILVADDLDFPAFVGKAGPAPGRVIDLLQKAVDAPAPSNREADREAAARRQSQAGVALARLGRSDLVWHLLRHRPDPSLRSWLIERLAPLGAYAGDLVRRLGAEGDVSARRALILALGQFDEARLPAESREALATELTSLYRTDPDPGIHSAIEWLLRTWKRDQGLAPVDRELAGKASDDRHWFVNGQGQTFAVVRGPVAFSMGSSPDQDDPHEIARWHRETLGHSFAIATKEVTVAQFLEFLRDHPEVIPKGKDLYLKQYSPKPDCPVNSLSWYLAVRYCRWLSDREDIPEDQMCYPREEELSKAIAQGSLAIGPEFLRKTGYRLPTEAEWEHACRAGADTSRPFGAGEALLPRYAWYPADADGHTHPVGELKPNDLGLFDVLGNMRENCHDSLEPYLIGPRPADPKAEVATAQQSRVVRGGSFLDATFFTRSDYRAAYACAGRQASCGLRVARTIR